MHPLLHDRRALPVDGVDEAGSAVEGPTAVERSAAEPVRRLEEPGRRVEEGGGLELEEEAWTWLGRHDERPYSYVDATSFALMRKLRIGEALAFDGDFAAAGFVELRPE